MGMWLATPTGVPAPEERRSSLRRSPGATSPAPGTAIPDAVLPRLFEPFAVAEAISHGADFGLRLTAAREILSLVGGTIAAVNLASAGIRFAITLPSGDDGLS